MLSVILAVVTRPCQWWNHFNIFIYILSLVIIFFFKTVTFEFNNHWLCIGAGLIRSSSVQFVYISFQFFFGCSSQFQFVSDGFVQVLHVFIFFFFHTWQGEAWYSRVCLYVIYFFFESFLTVSVTAKLPCKILYVLQGCWPFLLIFQSVHFVFLLVLQGSFDEALAILEVWLFLGFCHLEEAFGVQ